MAGECFKQNKLALQPAQIVTIKGRKRGGQWIPLFPFLLVILAFEILPFLRMLLVSLESPGGGLSFFHYHDLVKQSFYLIAIKNSVTLSVFSSLIGLMVGMTGANALTHIPEKFRNRILVFTNLTSNFAGVPLAFAYIVLLGTNGILTLGLKSTGIFLYQYFSLYSWMGLMMIYIYFQVPLAIMLLYPSFLGLSFEWRDAVKSLGGNDFQYWLRVGLPVLLPSLTGTFCILFANAMGAYATAYALTSGNYSLAPLRIGNLIAGNVELNTNLAAAIAVLMAISILGMMGLNQVLVSRYGKGHKHEG